MMTEENKTNPKLHGPVILSLSIGIIGVMLTSIGIFFLQVTELGCVFDLFGFVSACLAFAFGITAFITINKNVSTLKGKRLATISIILGIVGIVLAIFYGMWIGAAAGCA